MPLVFTDDDSKRVKMKYVEMEILSPSWNFLENGDGQHLTFGSSPFNPDGWTTIDNIDSDGVLNFDLLNKPWPWYYVSTIHCCSMLYQWDYIDSIRVINKCYTVLRPGGVLWLAEAIRDAIPSAGILSFYTPDSLTRIAERAGFTVVKPDDQFLITGRRNDRGVAPVFALKCMKP